MTNTASETNADTNTTERERNQYDYRMTKYKETWINSADPLK